MKKIIETYIVDSFTDKPFKGNPAGVCVLKEGLTEQQMQSIAKELGLSETAFIINLDKPNKYSIRYFSPVNSNGLQKKENIMAETGFDVADFNM